MTVQTIKAEAHEIKHPDGRVDVVVKVPLLKVAQQPGGYKVAKRVLMEKFGLTAEQADEKLQLALKREQESKGV